MKLRLRQDALQIARVRTPEGFAWTICCDCGNNQLLLVGDYGIRCHSCGEYHDRKRFMELSERVRSKAFFSDEKILKTIKEQNNQMQNQYLFNQKDGTIQEIPMKYRNLPIVKPTLTGELIAHNKKAILIDTSFSL